MTQSIFLPHEISTLEALYPNREKWMAFFWILSDRVQEEDEVVAEGMRFLHSIDAWPYRGMLREDPEWWYYCYDSATRLEYLQKWEGDKFRNYVPEPLFDNTHEEPNLEGCVNLILTNWKALSPEQRQTLWTTWMKGAVHG